MPSESIKIIAAANAEISTFLSCAAANNSRPNHSDHPWPAITTDLPAIAAAIEKAGVAIRTLISSENLDSNTRAQLDLYVKNLQSLRGLLSRLLVTTEEQRKQLADKTGRAHEMKSWLNTLQSTKCD